MNAGAGSTDLYYTIGRRIPVISLVLLVLGINALGLVVLYSVGRGSEFGLDSYFAKQCIWLVVAAMALGAACYLDLGRREQVWYLGALGVVLLCLVLVPGVGLRINGARRWISLGLMNMQVSDVAKVGFLLLLAGYFARLRRSERSFVKTALIPVGIIGLHAGLLLLQPDFGTAMLFGIVGVTLMFLAGVSVWYLTGFAVLGLSAFSVLVMLNPIRLERVLSYLDVEANRADGAYQLWQGLVAFGAGGLQGVGLGNGRQQLFFLPEAHTDFIYPIVGEELGLLATLGVVIGFAAVFLVVWNHLGKAHDRYQMLLTAGALLFIVLQALINMGVSTGLLPTKGMSLPYISYGGSNLVINYFLLGIIVRNLWRWNDPPPYKAKDIG